MAMRYCVICGEGFPVVIRPGWPRLTCTDACQVEYRRRRARPAKYKPVLPRTVVCLVCGVGFETRGRRRLCSDACQCERVKQQARERYRLADPEERRAGWRRTRLGHYGLTEADWDALFASQGGVCAACKSADSGRYWHTDHCHATGVVRGILCHSCNTALGLLRDSRERLAALDAYLERAAC